MSWTTFYKTYERPINTLFLIGGGLVAYTIYRNYRLKQDQQNVQEGITTATQELGQLEYQGITPSYSDSQFDSFVQKLVQAMDGCGTDEDQIYDVFRAMRNEADIRKLIASFGVQYYQPCSWSQSDQYVVWLFNNEAYGSNLAGWLSYDMASSEISEINRILNSNGIAYQF